MRPERKIRAHLLLLDLFDLASFLIFVTGIVLFIRFFIFNPYTVVGQSMEPTFLERDFIIVDKITSKVWEYERGDVIVFVPRDKDVAYIKRIIGLPGEKVNIKDGTVEVCSDETETECFDVDEYYLPEWYKTSTKKCRVDEFLVDDEWYFVLGDNRGHSTDSRCCFGLGCYDGANYLVYPGDIIGKVAIRVYPDLSTHR